MAGTVQQRLERGLPALATVVTAALAVTASAPASKELAAEIRAFKPVADTYVSAARPRANFGRARVLHVDGSPEETAYLRFDTRRVSGAITSVTLLLRSRSEARGSFAVRGVADDDWRERRLTYANAPRLTQRYAASKPVRRGTWTAVDVTPFVDEGEAAVSLAITTRGRRELSFGSRESRYGPRLVIRSAEPTMTGPFPAFLRA